MGRPSMYGNPAGSDAQISADQKSAYPGTDPAEVQAAMQQAMGPAGEQMQHPVQVGSPVQPEIRQDTPVANMGMGYREGSEDDPW